MKQFQVVFVALLLVFSAAGPAGAQLVQYSFTGEVTALDDPGGVLGGTVSPGTPFRGTCAYDLSTPDTGPPLVDYSNDDIIDLRKVSRYVHVSPRGFTGLTLNLGGLTFRTDPGEVYLVETWWTYEAWGSMPGQPHIPGEELYFYSWSMLGPALGSVSVGGDPWLNLWYTEGGHGTGPMSVFSWINASQVEQATLHLSDEASGFLLQGSVPEPATLSLLAIGGLLLIRRRAR